MATASFDFTGDVVMITGTARGFGQVLSEAFARAGAKVATCDIDDERGEATLDRIEAAGGEGFYAHVDVRDESQIASFVDDVVSRYGKLDVGINNAHAEVSGPTMDLPSDDFDLLLDTNLKGIYYGMKHQIRAMRGSGGGTIVNQSSVTSNIQGEPQNGLYASTKGGLHALTMSAAVQVAHEGIRINAIASALHDTPDDVWKRFSAEHDLDFDLFKTYIPIGRYGTADEIIGTTMFLASAASGFIVGAVVVQDGGWTILAPGAV